MKHIYKLLSFKSLILSIFILFIGASTYAETTFEKIKRTGKVTVGTEAAFPPFEFVKDGKIVESGFTKDVLENPQSSYTKELLSSVFRIFPPKRNFIN